MIKIFDQIAKIGANSRMNLRELRNLRLTNHIAVGFGLIILVASIVFINIQHFLIPLVLFPGFICFCLVILLNKFSYYSFSGILLIITCDLEILAIAYLVGPESKLEIFSCLCLILPYLLFLPNQKNFIYTSLFFGLTTILLLFLPYPEMFYVEISPEIRLLHKWMNAFFLVVVILVIMKHFIGENELMFNLLKSKNERLLHQKAEIELKNEEMSQFVKITSHDLQEPYAVINQVSKKIIEKELIVDEECKQLLFYLQDSSQKLRRRFKGIIDYHTLDQLSEWSKVELNNLLTEEVIPEIKRRYALEHLKINIAPLPNIFGTRVHFSTLFEQLIANAIENHDDKREINISIGATSFENGTEFYIQDNGKGIASEYFERIFTLFVKLEGHSTHPGVGLSLCKKIVSLYNGKIWLESEPGKGSTFYFNINH